ncbi:hypothetical protein M513_00077, partial [Trichuris suis]
GKQSQKEEGSAPQTDNPLSEFFPHSDDPRSQSVRI